MSYRILLVDDEPDILEFIGYNLTKEGYEVITASNGIDAVKKALEVVPHLILLDIMMPEMDGIETCRQIRTHPVLRDTLIAFLTARSEEETQLNAFDVGGDDYITKPLKIKVLLSHIKAMLKRVENDITRPSDRRIKMDRSRFIVTLNGEEMILPRKEFNLLALLYSKPDRVFTRDEIYDTVWGNDVVVGDRTIDVHIRKLREKIGEDHIITVKGVGYKFQD